MPKKRKSKLKKYIREFKVWVADGVRNLALIILGIILLGNYLNINFFGLVKERLAQKIDESRPLKDNEQARVTFNSNRKTIVEQQKGKKTKVYTGVRKAEYTQLTDGNIKRTVKNKGLTLEPGFLIGAGEALRVGIDVQWAYWNKWGLNTGINVPVNDRTLDRVRAVQSISFSPYWRYLENTSIWAGVDTNKSPQIGLRWKF